MSSKITSTISTTAMKLNITQSSSTKSTTSGQPRQTSFSSTTLKSSTIPKTSISTTKTTPKTLTTTTQKMSPTTLRETVSVTYIPVTLLLSSVATTAPSSLPERSSAGVTASERSQPEIPYTTVTVTIVVPIVVVAVIAVIIIGKKFFTPRKRFFTSRRSVEMSSPNTPNAILGKSCSLTKVRIHVLSSNTDFSSLDSDDYNRLHFHQFDLGNQKHTDIYHRLQITGTRPLGTDSNQNKSLTLESGSPPPVYSNIAGCCVDPVCSDNTVIAKSAKCQPDPNKGLGKDLNCLIQEMGDNQGYSLDEFYVNVSLSSSHEGSDTMQSFNEDLSE